MRVRTSSMRVDDNLSGIHWSWLAVCLSIIALLIALTCSYLKLTLLPRALHSPPDLLCRKRRIEMPHPKTRQRIQHRISHRRWCRDRGHRPDALRPERVRRRWHLHRLQDDRRNLVSLGESIVQQTPRQRLALRAIDDIFS